MKDLKLWYDKPAENWNAALPVGGGSVGGMVHGRIWNECISLNEDTFWSGTPRQTTYKSAGKALPRVRELLREGRDYEAQTMAIEQMKGHQGQSYQPLGDLLLEMYRWGNDTGDGKKFYLLPWDAWNMRLSDGHEVSDYKRWLDLRSGIAVTEFMVDGITFKREVFAPLDTGCLIIHITADKPCSINASLRMDCSHKHTLEVKDRGFTITMEALDMAHPSFWLQKPESLIYNGKGIQAHVIAKTIAKGGKSLPGGVQFADEVTFYVAVGTTFAGYDKEPSHGHVDAAVLCKKRLDAIMSSNYQAMRSTQVNRFGSILNRVELDIGIQDERPTDQRIEDVRQGSKDVDLEQLLFQYGRYLLVSSSRPGTEPANLLGIWNPLLIPAWSCSYTSNINFQMTYWMANTANLPECQYPMFDLIDDLRVTGAKTAKDNYNARGWVAHHNVDIWRTSTPTMGSVYGFLWVMGGAWMSRHLWEHYQFTCDIAFLQDRAWPVMESAALFILDWLVDDGKGGLTTIPSVSPENAYNDSEMHRMGISIGSTMDLAICRDLFSNCLDALDALDMKDHPMALKLEDALSRLPQPGIDAKGRLMEWNKPYTEIEPGHRHLSHLYGLYPGYHINPDKTPMQALAAEKSLHYRLVHGSGDWGWSCSWTICLLARLRDGQMASRYMQKMLANSIYPNLKYRNMK